MSNSSKSRTFIGLIFTYIFAGITLYIHFFTDDQWFPLLDSLNLVIHEAGHPITGILSNRLVA